MKLFLKYIFLSVLFIHTAIAQNNITSITIKTKPYGGTSFYAFSNLRTPYNLTKHIFPVADKDGIWKVEYESNENQIINIISRFIAENNYTFLAEKGYDYIIGKDELHPIHRVQNDSQFIKEFDVLSHLDEHFGITTSPEISNDGITYWEKGLIKINSGVDPVDSNFKRVQEKFREKSVWDFSKPVTNEEDFFKKCDAINIYRNYVLDSVFQKRMISENFYNYFKTYFRIKYLDDKFSIIPDRHMREAFHIPISFDTNFSISTRQKLKDNDKEIEKLFKCDECILIAGFANFIEDYLYKKLFNESKYRTIMEEIFAYALNSKDFSPKVRNMFLFTLVHHSKPIKNKVKNYPKILDQFYKNCTEPYYINLLKKEFELKNITVNDFDLSNTFLRDENGNKTNLMNLLSKHQGKYVYIDLWSTDYKVSMDQLSYAKDLYFVTMPKDFAVLFLGFESSFLQWKENHISNQLPKNNSYFCENAFETPLAKKLGITFLQRFLIFDKQGKLINDNATWPDDMLGKKYYED